MHKSGLRACILVLLLSFSSCSMFKGIKKVSKEELLTSSAVMLAQEERIFLMKKDFSKIEVERKPFSIYFTMPPSNIAEKQYYVYNIAAMKTEAAMNKTAVGKQHEDISYFGPYTGMATLGPYEKMYFRDAKHQIFYEMEGYQRADLVQQLANGEVRLKWDVLEFMDEDTPHTFASLPFDSFYLVVMFDRNSDGIVNEGEFHKIKITLK